MMLLHLLFMLFTFSPSPVKWTLILEPGYSVSTVADFSKPPSTLHPFVLLPHRRSKDLLLLDSTNSAFYSIPIPIPKENGASLYSGKGGEGFSDGDKMEAMFHKPRSFAVDGRDNVYAADRSNHAIRKINPFGLGVAPVSVYRGPFIVSRFGFWICSSTFLCPTCRKFPSTTLSTRHGSITKPTCRK